MAEVLGRETDLRIKEAAAGDRLEAGCLYVNPPDRLLTIRDGAVRLDSPSGNRSGPVSIDHQFRSLADSLGSGAIGVLLSGTGSDGTNGLRAIKVAGGFTVAQSPEFAVRDGMPAVGVEQGVADLVLDIQEVPAAIKRFLEHPYLHAEHARGSHEDAPGDASEAPQGQAGGDKGAEFAEEQIRDGLQEVLDLLRERLGLDFSLYKLSTLSRRVNRRMGLRHAATLGEYCAILKRDHKELEELGRDVHVNVTDFFRDAEAFASLSERVIPRIFEKVSEQPAARRKIRVWAAGCATGEEAYSLAIALAEEREKKWLDAGIGIQVFATDVDQQAIDRARSAVFPESCLGNVSKARRKQHFEALNTPGLYRVRQHVRDLVSFATHDLLSDPPFSRLHLISCRNLLIYLQRQAQEAAITSFHFALQSQGYLLLGPSEALGQTANLFRVIDKRWRLYQRLDTQEKPDGSRLMPLIQRSFEPYETPAPTIHRPQEQCGGELAALRLLVRAAAPPTVLINGQFQVLYLHGELIEFLDLPSGPAGMTLLEMLREEPRTRVRAAVYRASRSLEPVVTQGTLHLRSGERRGYTVSVTPCASTALGDDLLSVSFVLDEAGEENASSAEAVDTINEELNREVEALRSDLQSMAEALEQANDELRTTSKASIAMNEELQSTNEELETQSEELRSVNEELVTVNSQLRDKLEELEEAHADISNLLHSTRLPVIFLDRHFCIRRYTPEARKLLSVIESDIGRPIHDLKGVCIGDDMLKDAQQVIDGLTPIDKEIHGDDGAWYVRRILPYRTANDHIDGVVVTFNEVTSLKQLTNALIAQREQQRLAAEAGILALRQDDFVELAEHAVQLVAQALACPMCKVLELSTDHSELRLVAGVGWKDGIVGQAMVPNDRASQAGYTLEASGPVVVEDLANEPRFHAPDLLVEHDVASGISVIILGPKGEPYGVLGVHATEPKAFDQHQVAFVQQIANVLGGALQRIEATRQVQEGHSKLQSIIDNAPAAIYAKDLQGRFILSNTAHARAIGATEGTVVGKRDDDFGASEELAEQYRANDASVAMNGEAIEFEEHIDIDGQTVSYISQKFPLRAVDGSVYAVCGISTDITDRKRNEERLRVVMAELNHRVKNTLASIQALARVTAGNAASLEAFRKTFTDRLTSMGVAHSLLTRSEWRGANIRDIMASELQPRIGASDGLELDGPELAIRPKSALSLHMAVHELATNASKYGALSSPQGRLRVAWKVVSSSSGEAVEITWVERGGPPPSEHARPEGFGSQMIRDMLAYELEGDVEFDLEREGLTARIWFPLRHADTHAPPLPSYSGNAVKPLGLSRDRWNGTQAEQSDPARLAGDQAGKVASNTAQANKLLYVEDNSVIARSMSAFLRDLGFDVLGPVASVEAAMQLLRTQTPDVALLDVDLNGDRVYPVAEDLLERGIPFAFVTGYNAEDLPDALAEAPLFPKPLDLDKLEAWLAEPEDAAASDATQ